MAKGRSKKGKKSSKVFGIGLFLAAIVAIAIFAGTFSLVPSDVTSTFDEYPLEISSDTSIAECQDLSGEFELQSAYTKTLSSSDKTLGADVEDMHMVCGGITVDGQAVDDFYTSGYDYVFSDESAGEVIVGYGIHRGGSANPRPDYWTDSYSSGVVSLIQDSSKYDNAVEDGEGLRRSTFGIADDSTVEPVVKTLYVIPTVDSSVSSTTRYTVESSSLLAEYAVCDYNYPTLIDSSGDLLCQAADAATIEPVVGCDESRVDSTGICATGYLERDNDAWNSDNIVLTLSEAQSLPEWDSVFTSASSYSSWDAYTPQYDVELTIGTSGVTYPNDEIASFAHYREYSCPLTTGYTLTEVTFLSGTHEIEDFDYNVAYFCEEHATITTSAAELSSSESVDEYLNLLDGGSLTVGTGETYTLFYVTDEVTSGGFVPDACLDSGIATQGACYDFLNDEITELDLTLEEQLATIAELEASAEEKATLIAQLGETVDEQLALIALMEIEVDEQAALIDTFELTIEQQAEYIAQLDLEVQEQEDLIAALQLTVTQKEELLVELRATVEEQEAQIAAFEALIDEQVANIQALDLTVEEQAAYIAELDASVEVQAAIINELTENLAIKAQLVSQLTATNEEQAALIAQMEESFSEQGAIVDALQLTVEEDAALILELSDENENQAQIIAGMERSIAEQADIIEAMYATNAEQAALITEMELTVAEQAEIIQELSDLTEEQAEIISALEVSNERMGEIIEAMRLTNEEQAAIIDELELSNEALSELVASYKTELAEADEIIQQLRSKTEADKENIVELTGENLAKKAQQRTLAFGIGAGIALAAAFVLVFRRKK